MMELQIKPLPPDGTVRYGFSEDGIRSTHMLVDAKTGAPVEFEYHRVATSATQLCFLPSAATTVIHATTPARTKRS